MARKIALGPPRYERLGWSGSKFRAARLNADITQEQLARKLRVSKGLISHWETEHSFPRPRYRRAIEKILPEVAA